MTPNWGIAELEVSLSKDKMQEQEMVWGTESAARLKVETYEQDSKYMTDFWQEWQVIMLRVREQTEPYSYLQVMLKTVD